MSGFLPIRVNLRAGKHCSQLSRLKDFQPQPLHLLKFGSSLHVVITDPSFSMRRMRQAPLMSSKVSHHLRASSSPSQVWQLVRGPTFGGKFKPVFFFYGSLASGASSATSPTDLGGGSSSPVLSCGFSFINLKHF